MHLFWASDVQSMHGSDEESSKEKYLMNIAKNGYSWRARGIVLITTTYGQSLQDKQDDTKDSKDGGGGQSHDVRNRAVLKSCGSVTEARWVLILLGSRMQLDHLRVAGLDRAKDGI